MIRFDLLLCNGGFVGLMGLVGILVDLACLRQDIFLGFILMLLLLLLHELLLLFDREVPHNTRKILVLLQRSALVGALRLGLDPNIRG